MRHTLGVFRPLVSRLSKAPLSVVPVSMVPQQTVVLPLRAGVCRPSRTPSPPTPPISVRSSPDTTATKPHIPAPTTPRYLRPDYQPLSLAHPAFGQQQAVVPRPARRPPLSTEHPAFGTPSRSPRPQVHFKGPIGVSGFFFAVDPTLSAGANNVMNPNAHLTVRDQFGNTSRVRYRCLLESSGGLKLEAMVRCQVGWISPRVTFSELPNVIYLGTGLDVSVPFLFHMTMVAILDEHGCKTGSYLYFSGTPMLGLSVGLSHITKGRLVLDPTREVDPKAEAQHFFGHVHYRQFGFVLFKVAAWLGCMALCLPSVRGWMQAKLPNPLGWYSEEQAPH